MHSFFYGLYLYCILSLFLVCVLFVRLFRCRWDGVSVFLVIYRARDNRRWEKMENTESCVSFYTCENVKWTQRLHNWLTHTHTESVLLRRYYYLWKRDVCAVMIQLVCRIMDLCVRVRFDYVLGTKCHHQNSKSWNHLLCAEQPTVPLRLRHAKLC